jgi:hypothetical protein
LPQLADFVRVVYGNTLTDSLRSGSIVPDGDDEDSVCRAEMASESEARRRGV